MRGVTAISWQAVAANAHTTPQTTSASIAKLLTIAIRASCQRVTSIRSGNVAEAEHAMAEMDVQIVERRTLTKETVKQFAIRSTKESANLECRTVPDWHARSERVERFLAERHQRA